MLRDPYYFLNKLLTCCVTSLIGAHFAFKKVKALRGMACKNQWWNKLKEYLWK